MQSDTKLNQFLRLCIRDWKQLLVAALVIAGLVWIYGHSFLVVTVADSSDEVTMSLLKQTDEKPKTIKFKNKKKILVSRGSYQALVKSSNKSFLGVKKAKGFLGTTQVTVELKEEKSRAFVGNNPQSCMGMTRDVLFSYMCGVASFDNFFIHKPASDTLPTYVEKIRDLDVDGIIEGTVTTKEGTLLLMNSFYSAELEVRRGHYIEVLGVDGRPTSEYELTDLDKDKKYSITPYRDGFLVYSNSFDNYYYYPSAASQPSVITLNKPSSEELIAINLATHGNNIVVTATNDIGDNDHEDGGPKNPMSEIIVSDGTNNKTYSFKDGYHIAKLCGDKLLCLVGRKGLEVYDISGKKPHFSYILRNISNIESLSGDDFLAIGGIGVFSFNSKDLTGYLQYSFGGYKFDRLQMVGNQYILNVINNVDKNAALLIDPTKPSDDIDKQLFELQRNEYVVALSPYRNYIYLSPNVGTTELNFGTSKYEYNKGKVEAARTGLEKAISELHIDTQKYKIINTIL